MKLTTNDKEDLYHYLKEKNKKTNQCILLEMLLKEFSYDKIKKSVKFNVPRAKLSLKKPLEKLGYYIEDREYLIKKIEPNSSKKLIYEINNFLINQIGINKINIKIFHSNMSIPLNNLVESIKKIKNTNNECSIEITTSITVNDPIINELKLIRKDIGLDYFKSTLKIRRLQTSIAKSLKIFLVLINIKNITTLFLYDEKNYISKKIIKDEEIIYFLQSYFNIIITGSNKTINIDTITSQLNKKVNLEKKAYDNRGA